MDILVTVKTLVEVVGKLRQVAEKTKDADTRNLIADLNLALADLKVQCAELQNDNLRLQADLRESKSHAELRNNLELREGLYHLREAGDGRPTGPYCTRCFDADEKLILVGGAPMAHFGRWYCNNCKSFYK